MLQDLPAETLRVGSGLMRQASEVASTDPGPIPRGMLRVMYVTDTGSLVSRDYPTKLLTKLEVEADVLGETIEHLVAESQLPEDRQEVDDMLTSIAIIAMCLLPRDQFERLVELTTVNVRGTLVFGYAEAIGEFRALH